MAEEFKIHDLKTLEWYAGKLTAIADKKTRLNAQFEAMLNDLNHEEESLKFLYEAQARAVLSNHLEHTRGNTKHIKFLSGTIGFRTLPARLHIVQPARALGWAQMHAASAIMQRVDLNAFRKLVNIVPSPDGTLAVYDNETGEQVTPEGFEVMPSSSRMYVQAATITNPDPNA